MEAKQPPKWQKEIETILRERYQGDELSEQLEIETILRERYQGDELSEQLERLRILIEFTQTEYYPQMGSPPQIVDQMLKEVVKNLRPLAAAYAGFQFGVVWERIQNADRA